MLNKAIEQWSKKAFQLVSLMQRVWVVWRSIHVISFFSTDEHNSLRSAQSCVCVSSIWSVWLHAITVQSSQYKPTQKKIHIKCKTISAYSKHSPDKTSKRLFGMVNFKSFPFTLKIQTLKWYKIWNKNTNCIKSNWLHILLGLRRQSQSSQMKTIHCKRSLFISQSCNTPRSDGVSVCTRKSAGSSL